MAPQTWLRADPPLVLGHRGASADAPENTLAAFREALAQGADGVELDVTLCATGEVVVLHDATVDRTTGGTGRVDALSLAQLRALDAAGERIPTLAEVVAGLPPTVLDIELKPTGAGEALVEAVAAAVAGCPHRILLTSFDPELLRAAGRVAPNLARGQLLHGDLRHDPRGEPSVLLPGRSLLDPAAVARMHAEGAAVWTWTVNTPAHIRAALATGVDAVITDHPRRARDLVALYTRRSAARA